MRRGNPKPYFGRGPKIYLTTPRSSKKFKFPLKIIKICFCLAVLAGLSYFLFYSPYFMIEKTEVVGTKNGEIISYLQQEIRGKNIWFLDRKKLEKKLLSEYPEISRLSFRRFVGWSPSSLKIEILQKTEGLVWQSQGKKYLLDNNGLPIKEVGESSLPVVVDLRNAVIEPNKQVVSPGFINFVKNLNLKFTSKTGLPLKEISVPAETTFELVVQTEGFKVVFDTQGDLDGQLESMTRVHQIKKDEIKEYMDLRIEGRVYYK